VPTRHARVRAPQLYRIANKEHPEKLSGIAREKWTRQRIQSVQVLRNRWWFGVAACLAAGVAIALYLWGGRVREPSQPAAAVLPASARVLLLPFRKDRFDLIAGAHDELNYRVGMQAEATLVYAWSTGHSGEVLSCDFPGQKTIRAAEGHGAFQARSSGWYHWRWKNQSGNPITIHVKLTGYYEPATMPYDR
jgi:hypothetical protein